MKKVSEEDERSKRERGIKRGALASGFQGNQFHRSAPSFLAHDRILDPYGGFHCTNSVCIEDCRPLVAVKGYQVAQTAGSFLLLLAGSGVHTFMVGKLPQQRGIGLEKGEVFLNLCLRILQACKVFPWHLGQLSIRLEQALAYDIEESEQRRHVRRRITPVRRGNNQSRRGVPPD